MPHIARAKELIDVIGMEDYVKLLSMIEIHWPELLDGCHGEHFQANLHQMKSMSYSAGLDELGDKVKNIETMVKNGAYQTARNNIATLEDYFNKVISEVHIEIEKIKKESLH